MPARKTRRSVRKPARRTARRNPPRSGPADEHAATELVLYAENDGDLYRQMLRPIESNLIKKARKGTYDSKLALKAWVGFADAAAKKYAKEFASPGDWNKIFTPATRHMAAKEILRHFEGELPYSLPEGRRF